MAGLNSIAKMVRRNNRINVADKFLNELIRTIEACQEQREPSQSYKPSSIGGCLRELYYQMVRAQQDGIPNDYTNIGICETGSLRHDVLQKYVSKMKSKGFDCEWIDVTEFLLQHPVEGTIVKKKSGMETKCFNEIYNLSFLCDGIIRIDGEYYILEIKTESCYKFANHDAAYEEHEKQAACYAISFGIDKIIFLYENRDNSEKKTYLVEVTDDLKQSVLDIIDECNSFLEAGVTPPKCATVKKCQYCNYKRQCRKDG